MTKNYPETPASPDLAKLEESTLHYWQKEDLFKKSVECRAAKTEEGTNEFIFYDGPPFANGLPHYGHLLTGFVKDIFARYQTMQGHRVERRFGWDCHGMPAEMAAEKELGVSGKMAIEQYGIAKFNDYCRTSVMKYAHEWERYVTRQARWVDFKNDYKTMNKDYMESVMWAFKQLHEKGLVYESYRVMPYSWAMETPVSNFETRMDNAYREREDRAVFVKFKLNEKPKGAPEAKEYFLIAWTTTPWTLPSNLALAVSDKLNYACVVKDEQCFILQSSAISGLAKELGKPSEDGKTFKAEASASFAGSALYGISYEPLFPYFKDTKNAFRVIDGSSFIEEGSGTGVVHIAPGFGEDDQRVAAEAGIEIVCPVDSAGKYTNDIFDLPDLQLKGLNVVADLRKSDAEPYTESQLGKYGLVNLRIITWLKNHEKLVKQEDIKHNYPHCWRTDTPLIYRALPSWYVEVTKFNNRMVELNQQINWIPEHIKEGRFGKWLEGARDWSISRNRYWGSPIPVWKNEKGDVKVFGSIAELEAFFGKKVEDLHRPFIDELVKIDADGTWKRVTDVFDCWFESGSMPFAQVHYPFENKDWFEKHFPADFIVEYEAQTRGWFYTLMVLGTALFDKPPFKNVICHGVVLDEKGQKLSKRLNNYADPMELMGQYGADALRWRMVSSPIMQGGELLIAKDGSDVREVARLVIKPIWNAYHFFTLYANADGIKAKLLDTRDDIAITNVMDQYIITKAMLSVAAIEKAMDAYDTPSACKAGAEFSDALNNWYIRRSRERFWKEEKDADKQAAYDTLYTVLTVMMRALAPLLPLTAEEIYRGLTGGESVHLALSPAAEFVHARDHHREAVAAMDRVREICTAALAVRNVEQIRVRQPLAKLTIVHKDAEGLKAYFDIIADELNVKEVKLESKVDALATYKVQPNFAVLGKRLKAEGKEDKMKQIIPAIKKGEYKFLGRGEIEVAGEVLLHHQDEYSALLEPKEKKGTEPLPAQDGLVILDLAISPELKAEGFARDIIRMVQQARKDAGLHISDHIELSFKGDAELEGAFTTWHKLIEEQTLSAAKISDTANMNYKTEEEIEGKKAALGLKKK